MQTPIRLTSALFVLSAALLMACEPTPGPTPAPLPGAVTTIDIRAASAAVAAGSTVQFTAVGQDAKGNAVELAPVWSSASGGAINTSGLFTAGNQAGTFVDSITVTSGSVSAHATVTVTAGAMLTLEVTPRSAILAAGSRVQFLSTGRDSFGNPILMAPVWSLAAGGGAITSEGVFTAGLTSGVFTDTVRADFGGLSGKATVTVGPGQIATMIVMPRTTVLAAGAQVQFTVMGADANGNALSVTPSWSASQGGTISDTGLFTAGPNAGVFANAVRANIGNVSSYGSVQITAGALARLTLTPVTATMPVNGVQQFFVMGRDALGNVIPTNATWSVAHGGGTISSTGLFTAGRSAGVFTDTIKVSDGALADYVTITITSDDLSVLTVTPSVIAMAPGTTQQFTAFGRDSNGNAVAVSPSWTAGAGGSIDATGLFTAGTLAGAFPNTVAATVGLVIGHASVTVSPGPLANIQVASATMAMNSALQFTATGTDSNGNAVSLSPTWSVVAGGGTINAAGLFTSGSLAGIFTGTIRAESAGLFTTATVTVTPGSLATLEVSPLTSVLNIGATQLMVATGKDAFANVVVVTPVWTVVSGGGAIDTFGTFTAGSVSGTFTNTIRATSGAVSGLASVEINPGVLASVVVSGHTPNLEINGTRQLVATGRDLSGNLVPITAVWSVVAGGGTISSSGLFTAGSLAGTYLDTVVATVGSLSGRATITLTALVPPANAIALGGAANFAILAGTAVANIGATALTGDLGLDPGVATAVTGFPPGNVTGTLHINDAQAVQAQTDLTSAYLAAQGKVCPTGNDLSGIDLGTTPFAAGVYCYSSTAGLTGTLVLDGGGDSNAVFVFQVGSALTTSTGSNYVLQNGARATNVFWVVGSSATLGVNSALPGTILALSDITLQTGATLLGRGLARNGTVTLDTNPVTVPAP